MPGARALHGLLPPLENVPLSATGRPLRRPREEEPNEDELERARAAVRRDRALAQATVAREQAGAVMTFEELAEKLQELEQKKNAGELNEQQYRDKKAKAQRQYDNGVRQRTVREINGIPPDESAEEREGIDQQARLLLTARDFMRAEAGVSGDTAAVNEVVRCCMRFAHVDKLPRPYDFSNMAVALDPYLWIGVFEIVGLEESDLTNKFGTRDGRCKLVREYENLVETALTRKHLDGTIDSAPSETAKAALRRVSTVLAQLARVWSSTDATTPVDEFLTRWMPLLDGAKKDVRDVIYPDFIQRVQGLDEAREYRSALSLEDVPSFVAGAMEIVRRRPVSRVPVVERQQTRREAETGVSNGSGSGTRKRTHHKTPVTYDATKHDIVTDRLGQQYVHDKATKKRLGRKM